MLIRSQISSSLPFLIKSTFLSKQQSMSSSSSSSSRVTIIAMKGPPLTRKSQFSTFIAKHLGCPLLSLDSVLNHLPQPSTNQTSNTHPQNLAFDIICSIALEHLSLSVSNNVVIDSPLSSESHLRRVIKIASSLAPKRARVVIIECKPKNTYLWQMMFEDHLEDYPDWALKWYRPKNWDDMLKVINDDYNINDTHEFVNKLVLDPFKNISRSFIEAVRYMITRDEGDGHYAMTFDEWKQSRYSSSSSSSSKKLIYCKDGLHSIFQGVDYEANCMACHKQVIIGSEASYACKKCTLVLHKDCAESFDNNKTWKTPFPNRSSFLYRYKFPNKIPCAPCKEDGRGFSDKCAFCLFEAHLGNRLMPTVLKDLNVDEHFLSILVAPVMDPRIYNCKACGKLDSFGLYMCRICSVACHYKCLNMPRRVKHEHGGHYHIMSLMFSSKPDQEDYMCDECLEKRNPELWYYSCEDCVFVVHLKCVTKTSYLVHVV